MVERNQSDGGEQPHGDRVQMRIRQMEGRSEHSRQNDEDNIGQAARHCPTDDVAHEFAFHPGIIRLQSQEEGRNADGQAADERQLDCLKGIGHIDKHQQNCQNKGENVLYKEQCGGALDIVDDAPSLRNDMRHGAELRVQQDNLSNLRSGLTAGGHCDAAVGVLEGENVVDAVAGHCDRMSLTFEGTHKITLLLRRDAAEYRVFPYRFCIVALGMQAGGVDVTVGVFDSGAVGDLRNGNGIVAGDDADGNPLLGKVAEGALRIRPEKIGEINQRNRRNERAVQRPVQNGFIGGQQQHAAAASGPRLGIVPDGIIAFPHDELRRAYDVAAMLSEIRSRPLCRRGKGNALDCVPVGAFPELKRHGLGGFVVRLFAVVERREYFFNVLVAETLGGKRKNIRDLHGWFRNSAGLVDAKHVHMRQSFDAVHVLYQNAAACQLQTAYRNCHAGQKVKAFGDHADQRGDGGFHGVAKGKPLKHVQIMAQEKGDAERNQRDANHGDQTRQGFHHLGLCGTDVPLCLGSQPGRIALRTDMRELRAAAAGNHKAAGFQRVAGILDDGVGFAGQE